VPHAPRPGSKNIASPEFTFASAACETLTTAKNVQRPTVKKSIATRDGQRGTRPKECEGRKCAERSTLSRLSSATSVYIFEFSIINAVWRFVCIDTGKRPRIEVVGNYETHRLLAYLDPESTKVFPRFRSIAVRKAVSISCGKRSAQTRGFERCFLGHVRIQARNYYLS